MESEQQNSSGRIRAAEFEWQNQSGRIRAPELEWNVGVAESERQSQCGKSWPDF